MKGNQGFTLLELLMVVIIIAILASIALPQYFKAAERSRASEALQILGTIRGAELRYKSLNPTNVYTATLSDLDVGIPGVDPLIPGSALWTYTVNGAVPGSNAVATRNPGGPNAGFTIELDLDSGASCESDPATVYGLAFPATC